MSGYDECSRKELLNQEFNQVYTEDMDVQWLKKLSIDWRNISNTKENVDPAHYEQFFAEKGV